MPDGVLHLLPFAALRLPAGPYLVQSMPVQLVTSMTAYAALGTTAPKRGAVEVVGFGDPFYPREPGRAAARPLTRPVRVSSETGPQVNSDWA